LEQELSQSSKSLEPIKDKYEIWNIISKKLLSRNGSVLKKVLVNAYEELSEEVSELLKGSKYNALISINGIDCLVEGLERGYNELSSGEKQIIDLALLIAFNNIISRKYNQYQGVLGLTALDEVFSYLDPLNAELAQQIISKSVTKLIMVVTHDDNLQAHFLNTLKVTKIDNCASYKLLV
jgi:DNA repair exonuclease SbcCD ATPase subunit